MGVELKVVPLSEADTEIVLSARRRLEEAELVRNAAEKDERESRDALARAFRIIACDRVGSAKAELAFISECGRYLLLRVI